MVRVRRVQGRMDHSGRAGWVALVPVGDEGDSQLTSMPQSNGYRLNSWSLGLDLLGQAWLTAGGLSSALSHYSARWGRLSVNGICWWLTSLTFNPSSTLLEHSPSTPTWQYMDLILKRSESRKCLRHHCLAPLCYFGSCDGSTYTDLIGKVESEKDTKNYVLTSLGHPLASAHLIFRRAINYQPRQIVIREITLQPDSCAWPATQQTFVHITAMKILLST